jgi:hypothetical protein
VQTFLKTAWCKRKPNRIKAGLRIIKAMREWQERQLNGRGKLGHLEAKKKQEVFIVLDFIRRAAAGRMFDHHMRSYRHKIVTAQKSVRNYLDRHVYRVSYNEATKAFERVKPKNFDEAQASSTRIVVEQLWDHQERMRPYGGNLNFQAMTKPEMRKIVQETNKDRRLSFARGERSVFTVTTHTEWQKPQNTPLFKPEDKGQMVQVVRPKPVRGQAPSKDLLIKYKGQLHSVKWYKGDISPPVDAPGVAVKKVDDGKVPNKGGGGSGVGLRLVELANTFSFENPSAKLKTMAVTFPSPKYPVPWFKTKTWTIELGKTYSRVGNGENGRNCSLWNDMEVEAVFASWEKSHKKS